MESLLAFWSDAGVDALYEDAPVNRIARAERPRPAVVADHTPKKPKNTAGPDTAQAIAQAREAAEACETLEALAAAIAAFDGCPLKFQGAKQAVFARGEADAPVMIIGEGPGADEDRQGQPFVGRAGQLLDRMISAAGLTDRVFITNTVYWRPPGNRTPTAAEQAVCRPFLDQAIRLVKPQYLLLAGAAAAKSILSEDQGIMALRGRWFEWSDGNQMITVPALPTLHPAFLLRQPAQKKKAWSDLLTLVERLDRPDRST